MYCRNCGKYIEDNEKFCRYCGSKVEDENALNSSNETLHENIKSENLNNNQNKLSITNEVNTNSNLNTANFNKEEKWYCSSLGNAVANKKLKNAKVNNIILLVFYALRFLTSFLSISGIENLKQIVEKNITNIEVINKIKILGNLAYGEVFLALILLVSSIFLCVYLNKLTNPFPYRFKNGKTEIDKAYIWAIVNMVSIILYLILEGVVVMQYMQLNDLLIKLQLQTSQNVASLYFSLIWALAFLIDQAFILAYILKVKNSLIVKDNIDDLENY